jgi:hypothetical protein
MPYDRLALLVQKNVVKGINLEPKDIVKAGKDNKCEVCLAAKFDRAPFGTNEFRSTRPMQLLHTDLCEYPLSLSKDKWTLTMLDDYSDFCAVVPLAKKDEAQFHIPRLINEWENITKHKCLMLYSDRGGEYINGRHKSKVKPRTW